MAALDRNKHELKEKIQLLNMSERQLQLRKARIEREDPEIKVTNQKRNFNTP